MLLLLIRRPWAGQLIIRLAEGKPRYALVNPRGLHLRSARWWWTRAWRGAHPT